MHAVLLDGSPVEAELFRRRPQIAARGPGGFLHHLPEMPGEGHLLVLLGERCLDVEHVSPRLGPGKPCGDAGLQPGTSAFGFETFRAEQLGEFVGANRRVHLPTVHHLTCALSGQAPDDAL